MVEVTLSQNSEPAVHFKQHHHRLNTSIRTNEFVMSIKSIVNLAVIFNNSQHTFVLQSWITAILTEKYSFETNNEWLTSTKHDLLD